MPQAQAKLRDGVEGGSDENRLGRRGSPATEGRACEVGGRKARIDPTLRAYACLGYVEHHLISPLGQTCRETIVLSQLWSTSCPVTRTTRTKTRCLFTTANETDDAIEIACEEGKGTSFLFHLLKDAFVGGLFVHVASIPHLAGHAIIYASTQKNLGLAGLAVLVVNMDKEQRHTYAPCTYTAYRTLVDHRSLHSTLPVLSIHISGFVLKKMLEDSDENYVYPQFSAMGSRKVYSALENGKRGL